MSGFGVANVQFSSRIRTRSVIIPTVPYVTEAQAAAELGVTPRTIRRYFQAGKLTPHYREGEETAGRGRHTWVDLEEVRRLQGMHAGPRPGRRGSVSRGC
jgi:MerR HTH family regulatory protein